MARAIDALHVDAGLNLPHPHNPPANSLEAQAKGSKTLAICNVVGSMVTREANGRSYTHAGPEIGVASTKTFTAQLTALYLFALYMSEVRGALSPDQARKYITELMLVPEKLETLLTHEEECEELARQ